jgi:RNA polymerase sigma-70 factor (ECF subfamily)
MPEHDLLAERFEASRSRLQAVAYRMLGSRSEAEDAVQEAWLRLARSDADAVENLGGWLTTVVARVCLDMLRARKSRREDVLDADTPDTAAPADAEHERALADSVGVALLVVLETLAPAERVAFVLHDMFDLPFDQIASILERTPVAARQLASRARRRVQGASPVSAADNARRTEIIDAFLAASRGGDFAALMSVLDPDVVFTVDAFALQMGAGRQAKGAPKLAPQMRGAAAVAEAFKGRAAAAQKALVNGVMGVTWAPGGKPRVVFDITIENGRITEIELVADPDHLRTLDVQVVG